MRFHRSAKALEAIAQCCTACRGCPLEQQLGRELRESRSSRRVANCPRVDEHRHRHDRQFGDRRNDQVHSIGERAPLEARELIRPGSARCRPWLASAERRGRG